MRLQGDFPHTPGRRQAGLPQPGAAGPQRSGWSSRTVSRPQPTVLTKGLIADALCVGIAMLLGMIVKFGGDLPVGEILILLLLPVCAAVHPERILDGKNKPLFLLMLLWLLSQFTSDLLHHTSVNNMQRGLAAIAFLAIDLAVLSTLIGRSPRRMWLFALGLAPMPLIQMLSGYREAEASFVNDWKFVYGPSVNMFGALVACYFYRRRRYSMVITVEGCLAALNLIFNFRSAALICALSAIITIPLPDTRASLERRRRGKADMRVFGIIAVTLVAVYLMGSFYSYTARTGMLGDEARKKYLQQSQGKYGLLVGGRPETLVSLRAIYDAPLLGHGSWASEPKYAEMEYDLLLSTGYDDKEHADLESFLIPTHSHIFGAWVFAGLLGAVFWMYVIWLIGRSLFTIMRTHPPLSPLFVYVLINGVWDIMFSPFALFRRVTCVFFLIIMGSLLTEPKRIKAPNSARRQRRRQSTLFVPTRRYTPAR